MQAILQRIRALTTQLKIVSALEASICRNLAHAALARSDPWQLDPGPPKPLLEVCFLPDE